MFLLECRMFSDIILQLAVHLGKADSKLLCEVTDAVVFWVVISIVFVSTAFYVSHSPGGFHCKDAPVQFCALKLLASDSDRSGVSEDNAFHCFAVFREADDFQELARPVFLHVDWYEKYIKCPCFQKLLHGEGESLCTTVNQSHIHI